MTENAPDLAPYCPLIDIFRFLLVRLNTEAILQEPTIYGRRKRLREIKGGLGLGDAYSVTIQRIKAQGGDKSRLGMEALMWISHAERPLMADELCQALAVEAGSTSFKFQWGQRPFDANISGLLPRTDYCGQGGINCATDPLYPTRVSFHFVGYFQ